MSEGHGAFRLGACPGSKAQPTHSGGQTEDWHLPRSWTCLDLRVISGVIGLLPKGGWSYVEELPLIITAALRPRRAHPAARTGGHSALQVCDLGLGTLREAPYPTT